MIVALDASAAVGIALGRSDAVEIRDLVATADRVVTSALFHAETANALWKYVRAGQLTTERAQQLLQVCTDLPDVTVPVEETVVEALHEAASNDHPVYDTLYLTVARRNGATLLTLDRRLRQLAARLGVAPDEDHGYATE